MRSASPSTFPIIKLRLTLFLCGLECLIFGATITGWASIIYVFKEDGVFSHLCDDGNVTTLNSSRHIALEVSNVTTQTQFSVTNEIGPMYPRCSAQDQMFSLVFIIALLIRGITLIPVGWFFDKYGLLKTRLMAIAAGLLGFLSFAFVGPDAYTCYLLFPGSFFLVFCHMITVMTCTHMAGLAGAHTSTAVFVFCGAANSSIVVFLVVKLLHDYEIPRMFTLTPVASLLVLVSAYSYFFMPHFKVVDTISDELKTDTLHKDNNKKPDAKVNSLSFEANKAFSKSFDSMDSMDILAQKSNDKKEEKEEKQKTDKKQKEEKNKFHNTSSKADQGGETVEKTEEIAPLKESIKSPQFISNCGWFASIYLAYFTFIVTYNPWITKVTDNNNEQVDSFTNILAYCQLASFFISIIPGLITDFFRKILKDHPGISKGVAVVPNFFVGTTVAISLHVCVIVNKIDAVYISAFLSEVTRAYLEPTTLSFLTLTFPRQHYGKLFGISFVVAGIVNLLQYPLFIWADSSNSYFGMSLVLAIVSALTYFHPIYLILCRKKRRKDSLINIKF